MESYYNWFKTLHIISVICWMAAMFYLPRLYVYHVSAKIGSELDMTFQLMEKRLQRFIMNPAMISTYIFGLILAYIYGLSALGIWFHVKFTVVILLTFTHAYLAKCRKNFANGQNIHSEKFYRILNEVPTVLMTIAVIMVVNKPFD